MKKQKLDLKSVKNALSRAEMRKIMAGSDGCGTGCYGGCFGTFCNACVSDGNGSHGTCQTQP
jgi:hypothetical protein